MPSGTVHWVVAYGTVGLGLSCFCFFPLPKFLSSVSFFRVGLRVMVGITIRVRIVVRFRFYVAILDVGTI